MILADKKIYVAGHNGMVGAALCTKLGAIGSRVITAPRSELELRDKKLVLEFLQDNKPDVVVVAAAKVGGILANSKYPVEFLLENLEIQNSIISAAFKAGVKKLCFLGSSCIYPKHAAQPMPETALLSGPLEETNRSYAIAKIAGLQLCSAFRKQYDLEYYSVMPCNLYGRGDNYDPETSHVIPALLRKFFFAKENKLSEVVVWGTGGPLREFLHVDDCADAIITLLQKTVSNDLINIGSGQDISIKELARLVSGLIGFSGSIVFDENYPDGTPRKILDNSVIASYGWRPSLSLKEGLASVIKTLEYDIKKSDLRASQKV